MSDNKVIQQEIQDAIDVERIAHKRLNSETIYYERAVEVYHVTCKMYDITENEANISNTHSDRWFSGPSVAKKSMEIAKKRLDWATRQHAEALCRLEYVRNQNI